MGLSSLIIWQGHPPVYYSKHPDTIHHFRGQGSLDLYWDGHGDAISNSIGLLKSAYHSPRVHKPQTGQPTDSSDLPVRVNVALLCRALGWLSSCEDYHVVPNSDLIVRKKMREKCHSVNSQHTPQAVSEEKKSRRLSQKRISSHTSGMN